MTFGHGLGVGWRVDLGKGFPCYRTASAMAKRQDLSLVCLGNNQEVAGTGEDGKLGQRLGPKVPVGGHMRPQGAAQWLPPLCASHIRPRPPVTHQHRPYENRARPALGGGKVNSSGKRAAQPPRPRRVTGGGRRRGPGSLLSPATPVQVLRRGRKSGGARDGEDKRRDTGSPR